MPGGGLLTIGELTLDDVVVEGESADWGQPGGGALYSAVGALVWNADVAVNSVIGMDYPEATLMSLAATGLDLRPVLRSPATPSIGLWLLYEAGGARRQIEKTGAGTFRNVDALRPSPYDSGLEPVGVHIAPQSSEGQMRAFAHLATHPVIRTLDLMIEPYIDITPYRDGSAFRGVDAFLPSTQEVVALWGNDDVAALGRWLGEREITAHLVVKRGPDGADVVCDGQVFRVPTVVETLMDATGAGDAFCGGFLAGLVATGDVVEAAVQGVVSSSFVCETRGALAAAAAIDPDVAHARAAMARSAIRKVS